MVLMAHSSPRETDRFRTLNLRPKGGVAAVVLLGPVET